MARTQIQQALELSEIGKENLDDKDRRTLVPALVFYRFADYLGDQIVLDIPEDHRWKDFSSKNTGLDQELTEFYEKLEKANAEVRNPFDLDEFDDKLLKRLVTEVDNLNLEEDREQLSEVYSLLLRTLIKSDRATSSTTPDFVSQLIAELLDPEGGTAHDITCGIGETLRHLHKKSPATTISGQDVNKDIASLAETNLLLSGSSPQIKAGDSLTDPQLAHGNELDQFDYVVADFPFSAEWEKDELKDDPYNRFYWTDKLPRQDRADYAFLLHQVARMNSEGKGAAVVPMGVLFRKHETQFREALLEQDIIETVVTLPENTFENVSIPGAVIIFNKDKPENQSNQVQFIDGSNLFSDDNLNGVDRAKTLYKDWESGTISRVVGLEEIRENDYNLNLALYIDTTEKKESKDLDSLIEDVKDLSEKQERQTQEMIEKLEEIR